MEIKNVTFGSSVFMPFSEQYPFFDSKSLDYDVEQWEAFSDTLVLYVSCQKGDDIIQMLDDVKENICSIYGTEDKEELDEDSVGSINTVEIEKIRFLDSGFVSDHFDAEYELLCQESNSLSCRRYKTDDKPDFSITHLDYN